MIEHSSWIDTDNATNDTATATQAASANDAGTHYITSVAGGFGATASGKTLILKEGTTEVGRWNVYDSLAITFPKPIRLTPGTVANLELEAGGSGIVGTATMTGYTE